MIFLMYNIDETYKARIKMHLVTEIFDQIKYDEMFTHKTHSLTHYQVAVTWTEKGTLRIFTIKSEMIDFCKCMIQPKAVLILNAVFDFAIC